MTNKLTKEDKFNHIQNILKNNKPIDKEEKKEFEVYKKLTLKDFEDDTIEDIKENEKFIKEFEKAQKKVRKTKLMTIRTEEYVIDKIKDKAMSYGLNYQTYINIFLKQLADGKFSIQIG